MYVKFAFFKAKFSLERRSRARIPCKETQGRSSLTGPNDSESSRPRGKGRPRTVETAAPSLVELVNLVRTGAANTRQELERQSEFGRAVVADRLTMLGDLGLVDESELGTATGPRPASGALCRAPRRDPLPRSTRPRSGGCGRPVGQAS